MKFEKTKEILNQLVADLSQFSVVIHQTHWYMRGPEFLTLHPQMDEYMDQINEQLDVVSERLITLTALHSQHCVNSQKIQKLKMKLVTGTAPFQNVWKN